MDRKLFVLCGIELKVMSIDLKDYSYLFENFVFEGGGSKGYVYVGVIKVREYWYFCFVMMFLLCICIYILVIFNLYLKRI